MTCYRIKTPDDVTQTIEKSGLEHWDWPKNASVDGFAHYLLVYGDGKDLDTRGLANKVESYLERADNARACESLKEDAFGIAKTLDDYNANIRALGTAVQAVRKEYGERVVGRLAVLAVIGSCSREYLEERPQGLDLSSALAAGLELVGAAAERFEPFDSMLYQPHESHVTDHMIAMRICDFDENLAVECPWDGIERYDVPEVVALVRLGQNREVRALAAEIAMGRRIGAASVPAVATGRRSKAA